MNAEIKAAMTLEGFKEALRDPVALTQGQKNKDSLRYILESEYSVDERRERAVDEMQYYLGKNGGKLTGRTVTLDDPLRTTWVTSREPMILHYRLCS